MGLDYFDGLNQVEYFCFIIYILFSRIDGCNMLFTLYSKKSAVCPKTGVFAIGQGQLCSSYAFKLLDVPHEVLHSTILYT